MPPQIPPGTPPPVDLDTAFAQLMAGNPQDLHDQAAILDQVAAELADTADRFGYRTRDAGEVWDGTGWRGYSENAADLGNHLLRLLQAVNEPGYGALLRQLGDVLASAQKRMRDLKVQRDREAGGKPDEGAKAHYDYLAQQILQDVQHSYVHIGQQFSHLPEHTSQGNPNASPGDPPPPEVSDAPVALAGSGVRPSRVTKVSASAVARAVRPVRPAAVALGRPPRPTAGPAAGEAGAPAAHGGKPHAAGAEPVRCALGAAEPHANAAPKQASGLVPVRNGLVRGKSAETIKAKPAQKQHTAGHAPAHRPATTSEPATDGHAATLQSVSGGSGKAGRPVAHSSLSTASTGSPGVSVTESAVSSGAAAAVPFTPPAGQARTPRPSTGTNSTTAPTSSVANVAPGGFGTSTAGTGKIASGVPDPAEPYPVTPANQSSTLDASVSGKPVSAPIAETARATPMTGTPMMGGMGMAGQMTAAERHRAALLPADGDPWGLYPGLPAALGRPEPLPEPEPEPAETPEGRKNA